MVLDHIDPTVAEAEISAILAEQSAAYFGSWVDAEYLVPRHIEYLSDVITPLVDEGNARIILCAPPRHGKSEFTNVKLPERFLWKNPKRRVILAGHTASFAATFGMKVRDEICENFKKLGIRIVGGYDAAMDKWYTEQGGGMLCAGVGVAIVGFGADLFIIDDPTPDSKAAWSPTHQKDLREWYTGVADRRLEPNASVVVSMQRWPGYDFVSWLTSMKEQGRQDWRLIVLPDVYDLDEKEIRGGDPLNRNPMANGGKGEALWPERWSLEALLQKKKMSEDIDYYYAQYRQRPPDKSKDGIAYRSFNPDASIQTGMEYNLKLPILWCLDFNVDPMTSIIAQSERSYNTQVTDFTLGSSQSTEINHTIKVLEEIYLRNSSTQSACDEFVKRVDPVIARSRGQKVEIVVYGDASGWVRNRSSLADYVIIKERLKEKFKKYGDQVTVVIRAPKSNPGQRSRVTNVNNAFLNSVGEQHLYISEKCPELRIDLVEMKWHRDTQGNPTNDLDDSNHLRGHISDALGYLCWCVIKMTKTIGDRSERLL